MTATIQGVLPSRFLNQAVPLRTNAMLRRGLALGPGAEGATHRNGAEDVDIGTVRITPPQVRATNLWEAVTLATRTQRADFLQLLHGYILGDVVRITTNLSRAAG